MTVADQLFEEAKHLPDALAREALDFVQFLRQRYENRDDAAPQPAEDDVRTMLEQSRQDMIAGKVVPLAPVLDRVRAVAAGIRAARP
jgi:hypothetical protein